MQTKKLKGVSLFSSAGIAEYFLADENIEIRVANELVPARAALYKAQHPSTKMICGDISNPAIFEQITDSASFDVDFLIASPPCQGMSVAGKNRTNEQMLLDKRNFLVFKVIEFIQRKKPPYILIENVPNFLKIEFPFNGKNAKLEEILNSLFGDEYEIEPNVYDACDYGVAQRRLRAIIKMYKKGLKWGMPQKTQKILTVQDMIGNLPSLEAGEKSNLKWHFARKHPENQVYCMKHTKTGCSAIDNPVYFPVTKNGTKVKAYSTTCRRIQWDAPAPTITIRNDAISSQLNVHPGRLKSDGTYSDARVLTPLELMLLTSLPADWNIPDDTSELLIRKCIGESIPPLLIKKIVDKISY